MNVGRFVYICIYKYVYYVCIKRYIVFFYQFAFAMLHVCVHEFVLNVSKNE